MTNDNPRHRSEAKARTHRAKWLVALLTLFVLLIAAQPLHAQTGMVLRAGVYGFEPFALVAKDGASHGPTLNAQASVAAREALQMNPVLPTFVFWVVIFALALLGLVAGFNVLLRRQVAQRTRELQADVAAHTRVEDALRASEERFRAIATNTPDHILMQDRDLRYVFVVNPQLGLSEADMIGKTDWDILGKEDAEHLTMIKRRVLETGEPFQLMTPLQNLKGETEYFEGAYIPQVDAHGETIGLTGYLRNITERKRAEVALRESTEKFRDVFESANVGKSITLPTGQVSVNKAFADWLGYSREELANRNWQELTPPEDVEPTQALIAPLLKGERNSVRFVKRYVHKDGSLLWADVSSTLRRNEAGQPLHFITTVVDISERKRTEDELRVSEERFASAFHASPAGMTITRIADGKFIDANEAFCRMFEFERAAVIDHTSTELNMWMPEERQRLIQAQLESGGLRDFELEARAQSGRIINILFSSRPLELAGEPCLVTTMIDISARKQAETALRQSEALTKAVLDNLPVGIAVNSVDPSVVFDYMNDNFPVFYHTSREALEISDNFWNAVYEDPSFREEMRRRVLEDLASGEPERMQWENIPITRRGEMTTYISARNVKVPGKPLMISTVWDITERIRAEQERQRFFLLAESSSEFIGMCDLDMQPIYVNPAGMRMVGLPDLVAACQVKVQEYFFPEDQAFITDEFFPRVLREGHGDVEIRLRHFQTGQPLWFYYYLFSVHDATGEVIGWATVSHDITERKRAQEEQEKLQAQLTQAQKMESVGRLAGGVAHDFNNMLSIILGRTELMLMRMESGAPLRASLEEIQKAAERSADLTRQLLAFSRKQTIAPKVLALNGTIEGMLKLLQRLIGENIDLAWMPGNDLWPVKVDPAQIDQIVANLCVNARDAINGMGKITIETDNVVFDQAYCTRHAGYVPGEYVLLAVSDNGCGMDAETLSHLFEPFFTTKAMGKGTGLGLAIVYGIVKQNNGFVNVYSEPGHGTSFKIYLPRHGEETVSTTEQSESQVEVSGHETVLLVEDEPALLDMTRMMLEELGYRVLAAHTPSEAIRLAGVHNGLIDLLMTDVVMPEMNGRDLARNLQALYPDIRLLFMSGYTADVIAHQGVLDPGVHFIQKPFSVNDMVAKIRVALENG